MKTISGFQDREVWIQGNSIHKPMGKMYPVVTPLALPVYLSTEAEVGSGKGGIEGFHDAVRTPYVLRPGRHVGFFLEQQNIL